MTDTKDERPVPDGYEVRGYTSIYGQSRWYVDDVIHPNDFSTRDEALDAIGRHIEVVGGQLVVSRMKADKERDEARTQRDAALAEVEEHKRRFWSLQEDHARLRARIAELEAHADDVEEAEMSARKRIAELEAVAFADTKSHPWRVFDNTGPAVAHFRFEEEACLFAGDHAMAHRRVTRVVKFNGRKEGAPIHTFGADGSER